MGESEAIILGAGISGLAAAKCLRDVGIQVTVLERTGDVGGLWAYKEKAYGVMKFTYINVSKHNYCFSDYPIPDKYPDYLHNTELASYINDYTRNFDLFDVIKFHRQVNKVTRNDDETWSVETEIVEEDSSGVIKGTGQTETYTCKYLGIATGHHSKPYRPNFPGLDTFTGKVYHSVDYKDANVNGVRGKKVVVVGIGNSAIDVACNAAASGQCRPVYVSSRSGAWVVPNYLFGYPIDHYACRMFLALPWRVATRITETMIKIITGNPKKWNLNPKMHAMQTQPTVSPTFIHHIQRKEIKVVPNIKEIAGNMITFEDGTVTEADHLILCTGYTIDVPFLSPEISKLAVNAEENSLNLYKHVFAPDIGHSLAFIGFVQPASGGLLTMSEIQARWWAELCRNYAILPLKHDMKLELRQNQEKAKDKWYRSKRHTIQEDPITYTDEIASYFGAKPLVKDNPYLALRLWLGSNGAYQWRLQGPNKWQHATEAVKKVPVTEFLFYGTIFTGILVLCLLWHLYTHIWDHFFDY